MQLFFYKQQRFFLPLPSFTSLIQFVGIKYVESTDRSQAQTLKNSQHKPICVSTSLKLEICLLHHIPVRHLQTGHKALPNQTVDARTNLEGVYIV